MKQYKIQLIVLMAPVLISSCAIPFLLEKKGVIGYQNFVDSDDKSDYCSVVIDNNRHKEGVFLFHFLSLDDIVFPIYSYQFDDRSFDLIKSSQFIEFKKGEKEERLLPSHPESSFYEIKLTKFRLHPGRYKFKAHI